MKKPKIYNLTPAEGQALLNFQGRLYPKTVKLFETNLIEEIRQKGKKIRLTEKEKELHPDFRNLLIQGDCLSACAYLKSKNIKVDLVYIDPPFASGANYAKKIYLRNGGKTSIENDDNSIGEEIMYSDIWQKEDYLNWLYERLLAIREIMSEKATIYVHLDWHIGAYAKVLMDETFGEDNFLNEIIWKYEGPASPSPIRFKQKHDTILRYAKNGLDNVNINEIYYEEIIPEKEANFSIDEKGRYFYTLPKGDYTNKSIEKLKKEGRIIRTKNGKIRIKYFVEKKGKFFHKTTKIEDVWIDITSLGHTANQKQKTDYPTQKPEALLERIIKASSDNGMLVADFFCGSGTTARATNKLSRKFVACDIGTNAIQTSRDELVKIGAEFDLLKVKDGIRLFRNPAQTKAKLFSLIDGFKTSSELDLGNFWDGGIVNEKGSYEPVKFVGIDKNLTKKLLDVILEEIYRLEDTETGISKVKLIYAYKDLDIDQSYVNKTIRKAGKTNTKVELIDLNDLLEEKREMLYTPDNANIEVKKQDKQYKIKIKKYFSSYLKKKIDEYNAKKVKKGQRKLEDKSRKEEIKISNAGLELIEAIQFDTTLKKSGIWTSNLELEDKAGNREKIKGEYLLNTNKFKMKIRNIAGDEIIISSKDLEI